MIGKDKAIALCEVKPCTNLKLDAICSIFPEKDDARLTRSPFEIVFFGDPRAKDTFPGLSYLVPDNQDA